MSNVILVARDGDRKSTHAVLLASLSDFLKSLMLEACCPGDQVVIILPDTRKEEVEECLQAVMENADRGRTALMKILDISQNNQIISKGFVTNC